MVFFSVLKSVMLEIVKGFGRGIVSFCQAVSEGFGRGFGLAYGATSAHFLKGRLETAEAVHAQDKKRLIQEIEVLKQRERKAVGQYRALVLFLNKHSPTLVAWFSDPSVCGSAPLEGQSAESEERQRRGRSDSLESFGSVGSLDSGLSPAGGAWPLHALHVHSSANGGGTRSRNPSAASEEMQASQIFHAPEDATREQTKRILELEANNEALRTRNSELARKLSMRQLSATTPPSPPRSVDSMPPGNVDNGVGKCLIFESRHASSGHAHRPPQSPGSCPGSPDGSLSFHLRRRAGSFGAERPAASVVSEVMGWACRKAEGPPTPRPLAELAEEMLSEAPGGKA